MWPLQTFCSSIGKDSMTLRIRDTISYYYCDRAKKGGAYCARRTTIEKIYPRLISFFSSSSNKVICQTFRRTLVERDFHQILDEEKKAHIVGCQHSPDSRWADWVMFFISNLFGMLQDWDITGIYPIFHLSVASCGVQNDNDHLLIYMQKGGYVHIRHDAWFRNQDSGWCRDHVWNRF